MPRGVKKGENRFKKYQDGFVNFRKDRITNYVIPRLTDFSQNVKIESINKFSKIVVEFFNDNLPTNEKKIGLRTITQNPIYWNILEPVYRDLFSTKTDKVEFKTESLTNLQKHKELESNEIINRLKAENTALKSAFENLPSKNKSSSKHCESCDIYIAEKEKLCRTISVIINSFNGVIEVSISEGTIRNLADDMSEPHGILEKSVIAPYIEWLKKKKGIIKSDV